MFKCSMLRSDSSHYSDACNVVKGRINFKATENAKTQVMDNKNQQLLTDDVEEQEIAMAMCNMLGYSQNYSVASGTVIQSCRNEIDYINDSASDGQLFKYKEKKIGIPEERTT